MTIEISMEILEILGGNRVAFEEKCMLIKFWWTISTQQLKLSNLPARLCAFWPKWRELWKISRKTWDFLIEISRKLTFSQILTKYFWIFLGFLTSLWKYIPLEDNTRFLQPFSRFWAERSSATEHHTYFNSYSFLPFIFDPQYFSW